MTAPLAGSTARAAAHRRNPPSSTNGLVWVSILALLALAGVAGLSIGTVGPLSVIGVLALVAILAILWVPVDVTIWILLAVSFLVIGQAEYFLGIKKAFWISYAIGGMLYLRLVVELLRTQERRSSQRAGPLPFFVWPLLLILPLAIISSAVAAIPLTQAIASGRDYFFLWSVLLAFGLGSVGPQLTSQAFSSLPAFAVLQMPVIIYQKMVVEPSRSGSSPFDAVVGLFGGNPAGGGASGAMAFVAVSTILIMVSRWRYRCVSKAWAIAAIVCSLLAITLANVRFALILLPLGMFLLLRRGFLRTPLRAALLAVCTIMIAAGITKIYAINYTKSGLVSEYITETVEKNLDPQVRDIRRQIGRVAAIKVWLDEVDRSNYYRPLMGYGLGESKRGTLFEGSVSKRFPFVIARSTLTILLWELGLLGAGLFIAAILSGAASCHRAGTKVSDRRLSADLSAGVVILILIAISLVYGTDLADGAQMQLLCILILGQSLAATRHGDAS